MQLAWLVGEPQGFFLSPPPQRWDVKNILPLATFCMNAEDPNSVLMCAWWLLHSLNPFPGLSMLNFHIASLLRFHMLPLILHRIHCGDRFLSWQPRLPLSSFSYSHTKAENTVAELQSPWPCRARALCLAPCLLSWPQDTLLCPRWQISSGWCPAEWDLLKFHLYQTTTVRGVISRTLKFWRTDFHMK